jgi:hypothetical protein
MNWLLLSVAVFGIAAVALRRYKPWLEQILRPESGAGAREPTLRKVTPLDRMIDALRREKDPMERHRLLGEIVEASHRQRADAAVNKLFLRFAGMQVKELPKMAAALRAAAGGRPCRPSRFWLRRWRRTVRSRKRCRSATRPRNWV